MASPSSARSRSRSRSRASKRCQLRIIHFNDVYSLERLPKLKTIVDRHKRECANVKVTMAGDFLAPYLLSSLDDGEGMVELLNRVGVDIVCFGNHECDVPYEALLQRIEEFKGVWLNSNMPGFKPKLPEHHVVELEADDGTKAVRKVGFLGLLIGGGEFANMYRKNAFGGAAANIVPVLEAHAKAASDLRAQHPDCDAIIPLTHQDQREDEELAACGQYPVVLAGHDHEVSTVNRDGCCVVKAGQDAQLAAVVDLVWEAGAARQARPKVSIEMIDTVTFAPCELVQSIMDKRLAPQREVESAIIHRIPEKVLLSQPKKRLSSKHVRFRPSSMGTYLASVVREAKEVDLVMLTSSGMRGDAYYDGDFAYADLLKEFPYNDKLFVIEIDGRTAARYVRETRQLWLDPRGPQEAKFAAQLDAGCSCEVINGSWELTKIAEEPIVADKTYVACVNAYLLLHPILKEWVALHPKSIPPSDAAEEIQLILVEYFTNQLWISLLDIDGDGVVDLDWELDHFFNMIDKDGDGELTKDELLPAVASRLGAGASTFIVSQLIASADVDGNGAVSRDELCVFMRKRTKVAYSSHLRGALSSGTLVLEPDKQDFLEQELGTGVSTLQKNADQELERSVSVACVNLINQDGMVFTELGRARGTHVSPKCHLPGTKVAPNESPESVALRVLGPFAAGTSLQGKRRDLKRTVSGEYKIHTNYQRIIYDASWTALDGDQRAIEQTKCTIVDSHIDCSSISARLPCDVFAIPLGSRDVLGLYAWLTPAEFDIACRTENHGIVGRWLGVLKIPALASSPA